VALWAGFATSGEPGPLASLIVCQLLAGNPPSPVPAQSESAVGQEFIRRYRQLVDHGAEAAVLRLNDQLASLATVLPSAAGLLRRVVENSMVTA
jgi:hypothetical protein